MNAVQSAIIVAPGTVVGVVVAKLAGGGKKPNVAAGVITGLLITYLWVQYSKSGTS